MQADVANTASNLSSTVAEIPLVATFEVRAYSILLAPIIP